MWLFGSCSDGQCGDLAVSEGELVANLSWASGKAAADLCGCDDLLAHLREISYICNRSVFRNCPVNPHLDVVDVGASDYPRFADKLRRVSALT